MCLFLVTGYRPFLLKYIGVLTDEIDLKLAFSDVYLSFRNKHGLLVIAHQVLLLRQPTVASPIIVCEQQYRYKLVST